MPESADRRLDLAPIFTVTPKAVSFAAPRRVW
jgi:hypothetical protein